MKMLFVWALLSICCCASSAAVYNIIPDNRNCTMGNDTCYTLSQLIHKGILSNSKHVELVFQPGTYLLNQTLNVTNVSVVVMHSNSPEKEEVVIQCQPKDHLGDSNIVFQHVANLSVHSLKFTNCSFASQEPITIINITNCVYRQCTSDYALSIKNSASNASISISDCTFSNNSKGALQVSNSNKNGIVCLQIADSHFQGNGAGSTTSALSIENSVPNASISISNCTFSNNDKGVMQVSNSNTNGSAQLQIADSHFEGNGKGALTSDYALSIENNASSIVISNCTFSNNSKGVMQVSNSNKNGIVCLQIADSHFQGNGAASTTDILSIENSVYNVSISISNCTFFNNSKGVMQVSNLNTNGIAQLQIADSHFQGNGAGSTTPALSIEDSVPNASISISNCTFSNNDKGAIQVSNLNTNGIAQLQIADSHFEGNGKGALTSDYALSIENSASSIAISNCTFSNNSKGVMQVSNSDKNGVVHLQIADSHIEGNGKGALTSDYALSIENIASSIAISNSTFSNNSKGVMQVSNSDTARLQITDSHFQGNGHDSLQVNTLTIRNSEFLSNAAHSAVVNIYHSALILNNTMLKDNFASGSILYLNESTGTISDSSFENNSGSAALAMQGDCKVPQSFVTNCLFQGNLNPGNGGAMQITKNIELQITGCRFLNNSAKYGGALYREIGGTNFEILNSNFTSNKAERGGAIYCRNCESMYLIGSNASSNQAHTYGGFAYLSDSVLRIGGSNFSISSNQALFGGAIYASETKLNIYSKAEKPEAVVTVDRNTARDSGGAFYFINSYIEISGSLLTLEHNTAAEKGGAVFISDRDCEDSIDYHQCFFTTPLTSSPDGKLTTLFNFSNNSAPQGPVVYGGLLDRCLMEPNEKKTGIYYFKEIAKYDRVPLSVTSEPVRVCLCTDDLQVNCSTREMTLQRVKGRTIYLLGAVVDQDSNPVPSFVRAHYSEEFSQLGTGESREETSSKCSNLSYHAFTANSSATLILEPEGSCENAAFSDVTIHISIMPCPTGFESNDDRCGCDKRLAKFNITKCDIDTRSMQKQKSVWVRYDQNHLKVHASCPPGYCQATPDTISIENPDLQCANHRSGVICGACQSNYSIALGGSKCLQCNAYYTAIWLIPVFALAGIALVALLFVCNMTISHGTLNGLIFYANVVSITGLTSLQNCSVHPILSVFIAWVNLDLGVETCFYSGMDTYQKTWLQFAFPLYIWLLVGAVILACQCSARATKVFGRNSIAVLATLFLLSYNKILKTIVTAVYFMEVFQGSANDTSDPLVPYNVWAYDGNLEYLKGKHVPLFAVAMIFLIVLVLPYTLLLTFGQFLRSLPTEKRCVPRCTRSTAFISIMDAYHAPYNKRHRYWTGLLLLTRCFLFLAFATSYSDNQLLSNMYITTLVLMVILTLNILRVYKNFLKNLLEVCFLLNLGLLSGTLYFLKGKGNSDQNICKCTSASVSVSIVLFGGLVVYHAYLQLKKTRCLAYFQGCLHGKWRTRQYDSFIEEESPSHQHPTSLTVQMHEDLLESDQINI